MSSPAGPAAPLPTPPTVPALGERAGRAIAAQVRRWVEGAVPAPAPSDDDDLLEAGLVNSLVLARLLAFLETELGVEVGDDDLDTENFRSVTAIAGFVERKRAGAAAPVPAAVAAASWDRAEGSIGRRFLTVAAQHPDAIAVETPQGSTSYAALALRARSIAKGIERRTTGAGARVAISTATAEDGVASILAALLCGRVYVPLDPSFPQARLDAMLEDAAPELVVAGDAAYGPPGAAVVTPSDLEQEPPIELDAVADEPDAVASLLYTSGSSGRPKGVLQSHRNVLFHVRTLTKRFAIGPHDKHSLLASLSFDASTTDLYCSVLNGATLVPLDVRRLGFAGTARSLGELGVTLYHSTPTVFRQLLSSLPERGALARLRLVILGGEAVTGSDLREFQRRFPDGCVFVNGYGATETSGFVALYELAAGAPAPAGVLPIGWPPEGVEIALRERGGADLELPEGEISVTSRHVALGYLGDGRDGSGAFQEDPRRPGFRTYWTGDVGRRLPDGAIALVGRRDRQVKIRGFRVELAEVEAALTSLAGVALAAAVVRRPGGGMPDELVAAVQPVPGRTLRGADVRRDVARMLPDHMTPARVDVVDALPLTPTGKVDVGAVERAVGPRRVPRVEVGDGRTAALVAAIWADLLDADAVGLDDKFFDLGGNSLLLARVHERLERDLAVEVPMHRLFEHPTVRSLAAYLDGESTGTAPALQDARGRMERRRAARARRRVEGARS